MRKAFPRYDFIMGLHKRLPQYQGVGFVLSRLNIRIMLLTMNWCWMRISCMRYMMTSSNGNIFRVTGHLCGEFTGHRWIPRTKAGTRNFDIFFDLRPNKWLNKQSWGWWFVTPPWPLWRHCNGYLCTGSKDLKLYVLSLSKEIWKYIRISYHFSTLWWHR